MKTKCIRYNVNPMLLKLGVPVENLEKFNVREFNPTMEEQERLFKRPSSVKAKQTDPANNELPAIKLSEDEYNKMLMRKIIHASEDIIIHAGKRVKIVNQGTGAHIMRTLVMVGDRTAYFA